MDGKFDKKNVEIKMNYRISDQAPWRRVQEALLMMGSSGL